MEKVWQKLAGWWYAITGLTANALVFLVGLFALYIAIAYWDIDGIESVKAVNKAINAGLWTGLCAFYAKFFGTASKDVERAISNDPIASAVFHAGYGIGAALVIALS